MLGKLVVFKGQGKRELERTKPIISGIGRVRVLPPSFDRVETQLYDVPKRSLRLVIIVTYWGLTSGDEFLRVFFDFFSSF